MTTTLKQRGLRIAFFSVVVLFALMFVFLSPLPFAVLGWFLEGTAISHRIHEISFGFVAALGFAGLLAQLRKPEQKIAPMYQVLIPITLLALAVLLVDRTFDPVVLTFLVLPWAIALLHPARRRLLRPELSPSRRLILVALAAAVPLTTFAVMELRLGLEAAGVAKEVITRLPQSAGEQQFLSALRRAASSPEQFRAAQHFGHWSAMGAFALSILGLAVVAGLRPSGWRLTAWGAGAAALLYGVASLINLGVASAASAPWAVLAIVWGVAFVVLAEWERRRDASPAVEEPEPERIEVAAF